MPPGCCVSSVLHNAGLPIRPNNSPAVDYSEECVPTVWVTSDREARVDRCMDLAKVFSLFGLVRSRSRQAAETHMVVSLSTQLVAWGHYTPNLQYCSSGSYLPVSLGNEACHLHLFLTTLPEATSTLLASYLKVQSSKRDRCSTDGV